MRIHWVLRECSNVMFCKVLFKRLHKRPYKRCLYCCFYIASTFLLHCFYVSSTLLPRSFCPKTSENPPVILLGIPQFWGIPLSNTRHHSGTLHFTVWGNGAASALVKGFMVSKLSYLSAEKVIYIIIAFPVIVFCIEMLVNHPFVILWQYVRSSPITGRFSA